MTISPLQPEDIEAAGALTPPGWTDLTPHFEHNIRSSFCIPLKAMVGDQLAGVGNVICNGSSAWLAQIVVRPSLRGAGIGKAITAALIGSLDREKIPSILLDATDMGFPVYRSLGFSTICAHIHYTGTLLPPDAVPDPAIVPYTASYLDAALQLDREATGEDRQVILKEHIQNALLYIREAKLEGIYYPTLFRGLVTARTEQAGHALMRRRFQDRDHAMVPEGNHAAIRLLALLGYTELRRSRRMYLGKLPDWDPAFIFNVSSGALG